jgi:NAD-dependent deacetylase sirtuin 5
MAPSTSVAEFQALLDTVHKSNGRIMALCGAGLSAASGLGTFRGAGGMWKRYDATELATPEAFEADPGLVVSLSSTYLVLGLCCREGTRGSISER